MIYSLVKTVHVLSASILFGGGLLIAYFLWLGLRSSIHAEQVFASSIAVKADFLFTLSAVVIQPLSGLALVKLGAWDSSAKWLLWSVYLFFFIGLLWVPVVFIQLRMKALLKVQQLQSKPSIERELSVLFRVWQGLGWPAFMALIVIFFLMVSKYHG